MLGYAEASADLGAGADASTNSAPVISRAVMRQGASRSSVGGDASPRCSDCGSISGGSKAICATKGSSRHASVTIPACTSISETSADDDGRVVRKAAASAGLPADSRSCRFRLARSRAQQRARSIPRAALLARWLTSSRMPQPAHRRRSPQRHRGPRRLDSERLGRPAALDDSSSPRRRLAVATSRCPSALEGVLGHSPSDWHQRFDR